MAIWRKVIIGTATFVVPVTLTVIDMCGYVAQVTGISMQPTLNPKSGGMQAVDYVLLNRWAAASYQFQRGEIVSLISPWAPDEKIIKRIVALEGDSIRTLSYKEEVVRVPDGHCWVEGDHHKHSLDSNFFGPVALGLICAKATRIVWPPGRWQKLQVQSTDDKRLTYVNQLACDKSLSTC